MLLSENLSKTRKERGLTQEDLAKKLNVVRQTVSKWEKGIAVPDVDTLCKIADALQVSVASLLDDSACKEQVSPNDIATTLSQINEQIAKKNRNAATVWKILFIILFFAVGIYVGITQFINHSVVSETIVPDTVKVSDIFFNGDAKDIHCSFVPSFGNDKAIYTITIYTYDNNYPQVTSLVKYQNGICTTSFETKELSELIEYKVVLNIKYNECERNLTIAELIRYPEGTFSWQSLFDQ